MCPVKDSLSILIPTRDSSRWIEAILKAYRRLGEEPFFVFDTRSAGDTGALLNAMQANVVPFTPSADFAEAGMVEFGAKASGTTWILRFDDDEFPSSRLLQWARKAIFDSKFQAYEISRRDVSLVQDNFCYSRWPARWALAKYFTPNPQIRLFRAQGVEYIEKLHTPGFKEPDALGSAPSDCFFVHCNNLLRSGAERLEKLRIYAKYDTESAFENADESLPEITDSKLHDWADDGLEEFFPFFKTLPSPLTSSLPSPSDRESALIKQLLAKRLAEAKLALQNYETRMGLHSSWIPKIPKFLLKPTAEVMLTFGKGTMHETGIKIWNYHNYLHGVFPPRK